MIKKHTIHFTVGFSSFVDAASSRQMAVSDTDIDSERPAEPYNSILNFSYIPTFLWLVAKPHN